VKGLFLMKRIVVLGSTGSIGTQALEVIKDHPENFKVVGLAAGSNIELLIKQIDQYKPVLVSVADKSMAAKLKGLLNGRKVQVEYGQNGMINLATLPEADLILVSVSGWYGLVPTLEAIKKQKDIAIATKEILVMAGALIMEEAKRMGVKILPVDSEHSAIFQCLQSESPKNISRIILTSSGGPFRGKNSNELQIVTVEQALKHPNWSMGKKITIDSATMMNKGLEVIEASWLFDIPITNIEVVVHPQSIIHSMVEYTDGSVLAQLALPDMRIPIQYAFSYPERLSTGVGRMDFKKITGLTFEVPDTKTFKCLSIAYEAGRVGGTMPAVMNRANDAAVELFFDKKISFLQIATVIQKTMERHLPKHTKNLNEIIEAGEWAYNIAYDISRGR
jgi:1-deoxy-D-xylulose-5-phosphate reductoisomerase